ncbi:hypothetical protein [Desulfogranum japonicum]|uniref:hypothetical protein n=1 Tax=Desulfogranum japonicum TaxID=231447 RepID=UPI0003F71D9C|nr:hypothetical protein [Desulfogranum japonicum]
MNLLKFRIVGLLDIEFPSWLKVRTGVNVLRAGKGISPHRVLHMLQTINPPYEIKQVAPFDTLPQYTTYEHQKRRIIPGKKTVAIAIYSTQPSLVEELANIDQSLYATDWVEVGRRRDLSQWMSFVELSESGRWSEIAATLAEILDTVKEHTQPEIATLRQHLRSRHPTDRIKEDLAAELKQQLKVLQPFVAKELQTKFDTCLHIVGRAHRFQQAHQLVYSRLPLFLLVTIKGKKVSLGRTQKNDELSFLVEKWEQKEKETPTDATTILSKEALNTLHLHFPFWFDQKGKFQARKKTAAKRILSDQGLPFTKQLETILACSSALHKAIYGCNPLFLLDLHALECAEKEQNLLFSTLRRFFSAEQQCLMVLPNSSSELHGTPQKGRITNTENISY